MIPDHQEREVGGQLGRKRGYARRSCLFNDGESQSDGEIDEGKRKRWAAEIVEKIMVRQALRAAENGNRAAD